MQAIINANANKTRSEYKSERMEVFKNKERKSQSTPETYNKWNKRHKKVFHRTKDKDD